MMLKFHGAAGQIGRSCIELITDNGRYLLDAGLWITESGAEFPTDIENLDQINAVLISHAHLDHTGALPLLEHNGLKCNVFAPKGNKEIVKMLLKDSYKISKLNHEHIVYNQFDINKVMDLFLEFNFLEKHKVNDITFSFFKSGHIPGSSSILIENNNKKLLYTGDINYSNTRLIHKADLSMGEIDYLITEATYGNRDHPSRVEQEILFKEKVLETINNNGSVLIPAFAVGRAQEILLILNDLDLNCPIYIDGMAKQVTHLFNNDDLIIDKQKYNEIIKKIIFIENHGDREKIINSQEPCIVVTTSGMVNGGPIMFYLEHFYNDVNSSIFLTGYQAEGTNGKLISEKKYFILDNKNTNLRMNVYHFDFSAHSGLSELKEMILKLNPKKVVLQHGDPDAIDDFGNWITQQGIEVYKPNIDDLIFLDEV